MTQVLGQIQEHFLYLKTEKFHRDTVHFLAYVSCPEEEAMDQGKVWAN